MPARQFNGEGEIRTLGAFRLTRFQVGRNRPLCHLSKVKYIYHIKPSKLVEIDKEFLWRRSGNLILAKLAKSL